MPANRVEKEMGNERTLPDAELVSFELTSTAVMIPMVFCASLVPCDTLNAAEDTN